MHPHQFRHTHSHITHTPSFFFSFFPQVTSMTIGSSTVKVSDAVTRARAPIPVGASAILDTGGHTFVQHHRCFKRTFSAVTHTLSCSRTFLRSLPLTDLTQTLSRSFTVSRMHDHMHPLLKARTFCSSRRRCSASCRLPCVPILRSQAAVNCSRYSRDVEICVV